MIKRVLFSAAVASVCIYTMEQQPWSNPTTLSPHTLANSTQTANGNLRRHDDTSTVMERRLFMKKERTQVKDFWQSVNDFWQSIKDFVHSVPIKVKSMLDDLPAWLADCLLVVMTITGFIVAGSIGFCFSTCIIQCFKRCCTVDYHGMTNVVHPNAFAGIAEEGLDPAEARELVLKEYELYLKNGRRNRKEVDADNKRKKEEEKNARRDLEAGCIIKTSNDEEKDCTAGPEGTDFET
jgi:hypothetical protein